MELHAKKEMEMVFLLNGNANGDEYLVVHTNLHTTFVLSLIWVNLRYRRTGN